MPAAIAFGVKNEGIRGVNLWRADVDVYDVLFGDYDPSAIDTLAGAADLGAIECGRLSGYLWGF